MRFKEFAGSLAIGTPDASRSSTFETDSFLNRQNPRQCYLASGLKCRIFLYGQPHLAFLVTHQFVGGKNLDPVAFDVFDGQSENDMLTLVFQRDCVRSADLA